MFYIYYFIIQAAAVATVILCSRSVRRQAPPSTRQSFAVQSSDAVSTYMRNVLGWLLGWLEIPQGTFQIASLSRYFESCYSSFSCFKAT